jgi:Endosomal/lysosomal potassium channel TMEM175
VTDSRRPTYSRESVEFGRVLAFSDGLFAIAMTLLVVGIAVPTLAEGDSVDELADAIGDLSGSFVASSSASPSSAATGSPTTSSSPCSAGSTRA